MIRQLYYIILISIFLLFTTGIYAYEPLSKDIWLNESNTAVKVNCLLKEANGYMWLGTDDGLYRYNGRTFTAIATLQNEPVKAIAAYKGNIYLGFSKGQIGVWDGERFYLRELTGTPPEDAISTIQPITDNLFIVSTVGSGLYIVLNSYCSTYNTTNGMSDDYVYTILSPKKNTLLAATDQGVNEIKLIDGKPVVKQYTTADGIPDNIVRVIRPMETKSWNWIGTHQGGIAFYNSETGEVWTPKQYQPWVWGQINDILPIGNNRAWVCTEDGYLLNIKLFDRDSCSVQSYFYPGQRLYQLLLDESGNIWCATNSGLKEIIAEYASSIQLAAPFAIQDLTAMTCDNQSELWLAQKNELYSISLKEKLPVLKLRYTSKKPVTQLYCDARGVIWVGTFGDGLWYSKDHTHFSKVKDIEPLENESILDIAGVGDKIWIAGLNGVEELVITDKNKLLLVRLHNKGTGIGSDYVYKIFADSRSHIWMATDGAGVCMYWAGKYKHWDSSKGMYSSVVYNITEDNEGLIWAGTFNEGLLVYEAGKWTSINKDNGLQSLKITALAPAINGNMFVVNAKGIDEWHLKSQSFRHYERRLSVGIDSMSTTLNLTATDSAGNVYIPYQDGVLCFGEQDYNVTIVPGVQIRSLNTFYRKTQRDRNEFPHAENHITFEYEGTNYSNPEMLFYRYKLEGYNEEWITTRDESVTFPQLPSGDYKFVVQASMSNLFPTYGEATRRFNIAKPFWQQWWFIISSVAVIWFAVSTYIRLRERNLHKLSELQKERMLFEYEHLKSQVNPHFLFNSLNTLTGLIDDSKEVAMQYTEQLSDLYRNMLSHKDKDLISLREEWEILDNYIYIQTSRFGASLQLDINVPEHLKKTKKIIPMALQLLLENAIKHNIVSKAKPLRVSFYAEEHQITVSNNYQPKISKEKGAGLGLANIRKRYAHHTKKTITSEIINNEFTVTIPLL